MNDEGKASEEVVLLSVAALMLASTVFAPIAQAHEPGDIDIQSVTYRPDSIYNLLVTGTIQCVEGSSYGLVVGVAEGGKKQETWHQAARDSVFGECETTGPQSFTAELGLVNLTEKSKVWAFA